MGGGCSYMSMHVEVRGSCCLLSPYFWRTDSHTEPVINLAKLAREQAL